jgi:hypothetical protein
MQRFHGLGNLGPIHNNSAFLFSRLDVRLLGMACIGGQQREEQTRQDNARDRMQSFHKYLPG